jgi:uncharacterized protein (TIGR00297 family)
MLDLTSQFTPEGFAIGFGLAAVIAFVGRRAGSLNNSGAIAATLVGGFTYVLGGLPAAILLIAFFASSSLLSRAFAARKRKVTANFAKGEKRDWAQVAANGGIGVFILAAGAFGFLSPSVTWAAFAAALATVNADTWATELGVLSPRPPRLITTWDEVPRGTSGGISLQGTAVALTAALLIGALAWVLVRPSIAVLIPLVALAGVFGSLVDSYLGASVQAVYYCPRCKKETERDNVHTCGTATTFRRGWQWMDNDWVNFLSSVVGAIIASGAATLLL